MGILILCTHPKPKTNQVLCLSGFRNLNKKLKRKPYSMPKMNGILLKLEGFQYATSLDLSMGYYHIWFINTTSNLIFVIIVNVHL